MAGKGNPKTGGRQKGTLNKTSALLKDAVLEAADIAGGREGLVGYLALQARENPVAFLGLLGKLIPSQIAADVTQSVARVTADMMTPEEWAEEWAELEEAQALSSACLKKKYKAC
jgi:hypothetical protein